MKRFILIVENHGLTPADRPQIMERIRSSGVNVVDVRVASKHLEIDLLADEVPIIEGFYKIVETVEVTGRNVADEYGEFRRAVSLFDSERFWEAHETLEPLWKTAKNDVKKALHGLILASAAFVHLQKGDEKGFQSILNRAVKQLSTADISLWGLNTKKTSHQLAAASRTRRPFKLSDLFQ